MENRTTFSSSTAHFDSIDSIHRSIASGAATRASIRTHARIILLLGLVVLLLVVAG